jgi:hypothetical protein
MSRSLERLSRRDFAVGLSAAMAGNGLLPSVAKGSMPWAQRLAQEARLFCIAYIAPDAAGQGNQESAVARYPLALVPQDQRALYQRWRARVRELNPNIVMLAYQMTIEETTVPGPGHDVLRQIKDAWYKNPQNQAITVAVDSPSKQRRVFDPRNKAWQQKFLQACQTALHSDSFDGLFLDQCTIYENLSQDIRVKAQMQAALQNVLLELRRREPTALIIANSAATFSGVNGELNESRPEHYARELAPTPVHSKPGIELAYLRVDSATARRQLVAHLATAQAAGAYFGAGRDYQHVEWYEEFSALRKVPKPPEKLALE